MTRPILMVSPLVWLSAAAGVALGLACLRLAEMPDRWVGAAVLGSMAGVAVLAAPNPRRVLLFLFVFSLQLGLALYLTEPPPASSVGASWPTSIALPIASLTALGPLAFGRGRTFRWGGGIVVCAALVGLTTAASILASPERLVGLSHLVVLAAYFVVFLAAANAVRDGRDLEFVHSVLLLSLALQSCICFVQTLLGGTFTAAGEWIAQGQQVLERHGGTAGPRPAAFSAFLLPLLLLAVSRFLAAPPGAARRRNGLLAAAGCAALALTFTRASWIAFALGLAYLLVAGARRRLLRWGNLAWLLTALLAVSLLLAPKILTRVSDDHRADLEERWVLVEMAWRVIQAHPLTGIGAGAYPYTFQEYLTPELADRWLWVVHNVYVLRAAETGLPGLAAWLLLLAVAFRQASPEGLGDSSSRAFALGWRAGLLALAFEMLWDVSLGPAANSLLWFLCGLTVAARRIAPGHTPEASTP